MSSIANSPVLRPSTPTTPPPVDPIIASSIDVYDMQAINTATTDWSAAGSDPIQESHDDTNNDTQTENDNDYWTLAKIIGINKHSVTLVQSGSGILIKARPQSFAETRPDGSRTFVNISHLGLNKGDFLECCVSSVSWDGWDSDKGGKDIKGWVQECLPQSDLIVSNGKIADTPRADELSTTLNTTVVATGPRFSILRTNDGLSVFCDSTIIAHDIVKGSSIDATVIPFTKTNKNGKSTEFYAVHTNNYIPPHTISSSRRINRVL
jgi:hypothetical protein